MYAKKNWVSGETVTATALNNIENGIPSLPTPELGKRLQVLVDENTTEDLVLIPETSITISNGEEADISDLLGYPTFGNLLNSDYNTNFTLTVGNDSGTPDVADSNRIVLEGSQYGYSVGISYSYESATRAAVTPTTPTGTYFGVYDTTNGNVINGTYTVSLSISLPKAYWGIEQEQQASDITPPSEQYER